jgi:hypothetical protein
MLETALAVFFITLIFLMVFQVAHMVTAKILADHAAMRSARAKAVGFNDWMCLKSARVAAIPICGRRLWPDDDAISEVARVPIYLSSENDAQARGILDYEGWETMGVDIRSSGGFAPEASSAVSVEIPRFYSRGDEDSDTITIDGEAKVESHFPFYMNDQGL